MAIREGFSIAVLTLCVILTAQVTQGSVLGRRSRRSASLGTNPCQNYPCGRGGYCHWSFGAQYRCYCYNGYQGDRCEIETTSTITTSTATTMTETTISPSSATLSTETTSTTESSATSTGENPCQSYPCQHGYCQQLWSFGAGYRCNCYHGYEGYHCEKDIDDCANSPCKNGGSCRDGVNTFSCTCAAGYTGKTCTTRVNPCQSYPCRNGGYCYRLWPIGAGYRCYCWNGYQGDHCEIAKTTGETTVSSTATSTETTITSTELTTEWLTTAAAAPLDCATCDFNNNVGYLVDPAYCGCYYRCLRTGPGQYHRYPRECCPSGLFWNPAALTCDFPQNVAVSGCQTSQGKTPPPTTTTTATPQGSPCPYLADPSDVHNYQVYSAGSWITMSCAGGLAWSQVVCTCILGSSGPNLVPCNQDFLLYFPFDDHYNDVGCHHAVSDIYNSPALSWDAKKTKSASFSGGDRLTVGYLNNWFSGQTITGWTVSVWFKLSGTTQGLEGLVNNGNCNNKPSFSLYLEAGNVLKGSIDTVSGPPAVVTTTVSAYSWNHAALVYDGQQVSLYYNGALVDQTAASGAMKNSQCPMNIAHHGTSQTTGQFNGFLDELKIFDRAIAAAEVLSMYQNPWG